MNENTSWRDAQAAAFAEMNEAERVEYDQSVVETELRLRLAELVYDGRAAAGLSQVELAYRAGTRQSVISNIENGAQTPSVIMLGRLAHALGRELVIDLSAAETPAAVHNG